MKDCIGKETTIKTELNFIEYFYTIFDYYINKKQIN